MFFDKNLMYYSNRLCITWQCVGQQGRAIFKLIQNIGLLSVLRIPVEPLAATDRRRYTFSKNLRRHDLI